MYVGLLLTVSLMVAAVKEAAAALASRSWGVPFRWNPQYLCTKYRIAGRFFFKKLANKSGLKSAGPGAFFFSMV